MTLNYRIVGDGAPLLLIHGMGVSFSIWDNLIPQLSPYYKLIMIELPGHGHSPEPPEDASYYAASAEEIEALRRALQIPYWDILGYSVGAWVAQAYGQRYPERINHLMILCPAVLSLPGWASMRNLVWIDRHAPAFGSWMLSGWRLHALVRLLGFGGTDHWYASAWTREIGARPVHLIKRLIYQMPGCGRADFRVPARPVLFLWARADAIAARPLQMGPFDRLIPGNHSAPLLAAEDIAREVLAFAGS